jgi:hypothetical protein
LTAFISTLHVGLLADIALSCLSGSSAIHFYLGILGAAMLSYSQRAGDFLVTSITSVKYFQFTLSTSYAQLRRKPGFSIVKRIWK